VTAYRDKSGQRQYGTLNGEKAFLIDGEVFLVVGRDNGWVRVKGRVNEFKPLTQEQANDPKFQVGLGVVGYGSIDRYWGAR